ncbi:hypothetical protein GCM10010182_05570 [Actinomadura cremea]|nr:hypothetical protein GCM10010182_05570 [Actinomadura cremea]
MGLNTYRAVLDQGIGSPYEHLRQYVASSSLDRIDDPAVELVRDPGALVEGGFDPTAFTPTDHRSFPNGAGITWYARGPVHDSLNGGEWCGWDRVRRGLDRP